MPAPVQNTSVAAKAVGFLTDRYRSQVSIPAIVRALSAGKQDLENAIMPIFSLGTLKGAQLFTPPQTNPVLDAIGRIVGQPRAGVSDAVFQALIFLRVAVDSFSGRVTDISRIAAVLLRTAVGPVIYWEAGAGGTSWALFVAGMTLPADAVAGVLTAAHVSGQGINNFAYTTWPFAQTLLWADATNPSTTGQGTWGDSVSGGIGGLLAATFGV